MSTAAGRCGTNTDCQRWKLYLQPIDLSSPPRLLAAGTRPGPTIDEPNAISDGRIVVWQSLGSDGMIDTDEATLDRPGTTRVIAHEYGPAIELALDGAGNVLIDTPDGKTTSATSLVRVSLTTGHSSATGLRNAHYPTILGSHLVSVTGQDHALTTVDSSAYSPHNATTDTQKISTSGDEYDAQQVDSRHVLTWNVSGLTLVNTQDHDSATIHAMPVVQARVTSGADRIVFAMQQAGREVLVVAGPVQNR